MKRMVIGYVAGCVLAGAALAAAALPEVRLQPDQPIVATLDGAPLRLLPMASGGRVILNPSAVERLQLKAGMFGARGKVGPVIVPGSTLVAKIGIGSSVESQRIVWFDRVFAPGYDGSIGPAHIPGNVVTFQIRAAQAGEQRFVLPMAMQSGFDQLGSAIGLGGETIQVNFDLQRDVTLATAAASALIAQAQDGTFRGEGWRQPIRLGVDRPARRMVLDRPLVVGPLRLTEMVARVSDGGDASGIADADADPDEIVVNGRSKVKPRYSLVIGRDALAGCSSIAFDKVRKQVVLMCKPQAGQP